MSAWAWMGCLAVIPLSCAAFCLSDPWNRAYLCCESCGTFRGAAELLWIKPIGCESDVILLDERPLNVSQLPAGKGWNHEVGFKPGFRLGIAYLFPDRCTDFEVIFTGLWCSRKGLRTTPLGGGIWPVIGQPRYLNARLGELGVGNSGQDAWACSRIQYGFESISVQPGRSYCLQKKLIMRGAVGGEWVRIRDRRNIVYRGTVVMDQLGMIAIQTQRHQVRICSEGEGFGPRVDLEACYQVACGWTVSFSTAVGVLVGQRKLRFCQDSFGQTLPTSPSLEDFDVHMGVSQRDRCLGVSHLIARLGAGYQVGCGRCFCSQVWLGYEWQSFIGVLPQMSFTGCGGTGRESFRNFNLTGLVIALRIAI